MHTQGNQPHSSLGTYKGKGKTNQYENYDDEFYKYRKNNASSLKEWSLMESQLMPKKESTQQTYVNPNPQSYSAKINNYFETVNYDVKSTEQLSAQMKQMRKIMQQCNELLNSKLNKYELVEKQPKVLMLSNKPQKQSQLLLAQIQINNKTLENQEKEIHQLKKKQKDLQERDYLIELEERVSKVGREIHHRKKQKYDSGVVVHRLDNKLLQLRDIALEEDKEIKVLKYQIMHHFKKFHENRQKMEELDNAYEDLRNKDSELNQRYREFVKQAQNKHLLVKANPNLVEMKRQTDQTLSRLDYERRKIDIVGRSQHWKQQRLEKQMWEIQKQLHQIQFNVEQLTATNEQVSAEVDQKIQKNNITPQKMRSIAYRFNQNIIKSNANKINLGPFVKLDRNKDPQKSSRVLNKSTQIPSNIATIQQNDPSKSPPQTHKINDKNNDSGSPQKNQFRINLKPKMKIKKKGQKNQTIDVGQLEKDQEKSGYINMPSYRPARFKKLMSGKKDTRLNVPLSDDYMKSLEAKGKKNLNV